jgi:hypothetical protein
MSITFKGWDFAYQESNLVVALLCVIIINLYCFGMRVRNNKNSTRFPIDVGLFIYNIFKAHTGDQNSSINFSIVVNIGQNS